VAILKEKLTRTETTTSRLTNKLARHLHCKSTVFSIKW